MEEQPHEQPPEQAPEPSGKPAIFQNVNGIIAGVTGLLVAAGGLVATWDRIFPPKQAEPQTAAATAAPVAAASPAEAPAGGGEAAPEPDPTYYDTDVDGTLRNIDGLWVETTKDGTKYRYEEISNDGSMVVAIDRGGGEEGEDVYLRWPNFGGQAQKSWDRQYTWYDSFNVTPKAS